MPKMLLSILLFLLSTPVLAAYKCQEHGRITYGDSPCPGAIEIANDKFDPAQDAAAQRRLNQEKKESSRLGQARERQQASDERAQQQVARKQAAQAKKCKTSAMRKQWAEDDAKQASTKNQAKAVKTARRTAEKHEMECGR